MLDCPLSLGVSETIRLVSNLELESDPLQMIRTSHIRRRREYMDKMKYPQPDYAKQLSNIILKEFMDYLEGAGIQSVSFRNNPEKALANRVHTLCHAYLSGMQSLIDGLTDIKVEEEMRRNVPQSDLCGWCGEPFSKCECSSCKAGKC